ncbi:hypothetical protein B0A50_02559 [Salinomyces thailandicus]|uniref:Uncharacterized protein n=1 Tax=Salinomyces thailandicus TaxID=706561 RepID=A0A4U0U6T7_9PEZI|nr:hypothetical protein B0A50_02559 [Salinomyces thailandica]
MAKTKQNKIPTKITATTSTPRPSDDVTVNFNPRTGRPMRNAPKADSPFVDSAVAISDDESSDDEYVLAPTSRANKRKRSPSPTLTDNGNVSDAISEHDHYFDEDDVAAVPQRKATETSLSTSSPTFAQGSQIVLKDLVINVPSGHTGPVILHLTPGMATAPLQAPLHVSAPKPAAPAKPKGRKRARKEAVPTSREGAGFLDLPAELRNEIYRLAFVADGKFNLARPTNFARSAAFLRTCRQVHEEARDILYGENEFLFVRRVDRHGSFWEDEWKEVGFKSIRKFVKTIGVENTSLIRHLSFQFEDATPCLNPDSMSHEERRFVHDDGLMSILRHLGDYAQLQTLKLCFHGRRRVETSDDRFLAYLKRIRADTVELVKFPIGRPESVYAMESKQAEVVRKGLMKAMVRKEKLYD